MEPETQPILFDSHMHTPLCKHATGHPRAYARQAIERGLKGIIFTCHSPMPGGFSHAVRMDPDKFGYYVRLVEDTAAEMEDQIEIRLGLESDFFPGMESWLTELHERAEFHYILGSVHYHVAEYSERYFKGDVVAFQKQYFDHLAESAEWGLFDALAHPDLIKNASPIDWDLDRVRPEIEASLDRIAATGVAMELNTSGLNKIVPETNPGPEILAMMAERGIPVVLGSDSHFPKRVGADFEYALCLLRDAGFTEVQQFENRKPEAIAIDAAEKTLRGTEMSSAGASC